MSLVKFHRRVSGRLITGKQGQTNAIICLPPLWVALLGDPTSCEGYIYCRPNKIKQEVDHKKKGILRQILLEVYSEIDFCEMRHLHRSLTLSFLVMVHTDLYMDLRTLFLSFSPV